MTSITIGRRYCGPPNSGNGGYVCGRLAAQMANDAEVTLHSPPPLDKPLDVIVPGEGLKDGAWQLCDGNLVVATARPASIDLTRLEQASFAEAAAAELCTPVKPDEHLLPTCFVCGPARTPGDGLRIFAGPLPGKSAGASPVLAATWTPDPSLAVADGRVGSEFLWSALDCPTGYAACYSGESGAFERTPILLGRMAARIAARPRPGERCVITAWGAGRDGRKRFAEAALHGDAGTLLAVARATWIAVDRNVALGRA